jgi:hypothetical protein
VLLPIEVAEERHCSHRWSNCIELRFGQEEGIQQVFFPSAQVVGERVQQSHSLTLTTIQTIGMDSCPEGKV